MTIGLAVLAATVWGMSSGFAAIASRRRFPLSVTLWSQLIGLLVGLPAVVVVNWSLASRGFAPAAIAGLGSGVSLLLLYASMRHLFVGIAASISAVVACIIPVVYSAIWKSVDLLELLGMTLCVTALITVVGRRETFVVDASRELTRSNRQSGRTLGVVLALLSGAAMSVYYIGLSGSPGTQQVADALESRLAATLVLACIALFGRRECLSFPRDGLSQIARVGVCGVIGALSYAVAVRNGSLALVVPIVSVSPLVTVVFGWVVFRERMSRRQIGGLLLAMVGVVIVSA